MPQAPSYDKHSQYPDTAVYDQDEPVLLMRYRGEIIQIDFERHTITFLVAQEGFDQPAWTIKGI